MNYLFTPSTLVSFVSDNAKLKCLVMILKFMQSTSIKEILFGSKTNTGGCKLVFLMCNIENTFEKNYKRALRIVASSQLKDSD